MKFLNMFKKRQEQPQDETPVVTSITYSIDNTGEMFVDINIDDFDDESIDGLAQLISVISTVKCQLITIEMIKQAFSEEGKIAEYIGLISKIASNTASYTEELKQQDSSEEPCIKPSDMF